MEKIKDIKDFEAIAQKVRLKILELVSKTHSPHIGPSFSCVEVLVALYFEVMNITKATLSDPKRDRFILSKGHACPSLYAVLNERGFLSNDNLDGFAIDGGELQQHPDLDLSRGIEFSTGSLGHGLSVAAGMALDGRVKKCGYKVFVMLGDGELNEGSVWEAAMFSAHQGLSQLVAIVDHNRMQALGPTCDLTGLDPLLEKWQAFGWEAQEIEGHDFNAIFNAFHNLSATKPNVIIAKTIKGKGVSFMENDILWHYRYPQGDEYDNALQELSK